LKHSNHHIKGKGLLSTFIHAEEKTPHRMCTALWETGEWPDDWTNSVFIPIKKKVCNWYGTLRCFS